MMKNARRRTGRDGKREIEAAIQFYTAEAPCQKFLSRLEGLRQTGPGCWIARCPAHDDKRPSLSIKENADGAILLHCFTGCSAADIVAAIGLELRDLFPPTDCHRSPPKSHFERKRYGQAVDALRALAHESLIVLVAAGNLAAGQSLTAEDLDRVRQAEDRIRAARGVAA